jgi:hypothetical protein
MTERGGGPTPTELRNMGPRGVPTYPSESRNGGTKTDHPWPRNATPAVGTTKFSTYSSCPTQIILITYGCILEY